MRFDRIDFIKYGPFTGEFLVLASRVPDFHVIYGDNEAGKSTALRGITGLLFGIPVRTTDTFLHQSNQLRIGAVISADGQRLEFRRRKGNKQTLLDGSEQVLPDSAIAAFMRELDLERFRRFYGIDHQMLREGGRELLEGKGDVGKTLFEVAGLLDLRTLLAGLESQAEELFAGKTKVINIGLSQYTAARAHKMNAAISREQFESLERQLNDTEVLLEQRKRGAAETQQQLVRLRRIKGNKPDVAKLASARAELSGLEAIPELDTNARQKRERAQEAIAEARKEIEKLNNRMGRRREEVSALPLYVGLDRYADSIAELNQQTGQYRKNLADEAKRQREAETAFHNASDHWQRTFPDRRIDEAESLRSLYAERVTLLSMISSHGKLEALEGAVKADVEKATRERTGLVRQLETTALPRDTAPLVAAITEARSLGDAEARQSKLQAEAQKILATATSELNTLRLWHRSLTELEAISLPLATTVERYATDWAELEITRKEYRKEVGKQLAEMRRLEAKSAELGAKADVPTAADLSSARQRRNELWQVIRSFAFEASITRAEAAAKAEVPEELATAFESEIKHADDISDRRFDNAQVVVERDLANLQLKKQRDRAAEIENELRELDIRSGEMQARWAEEWPDFTEGLLPPAEMQEWRRQRAAILDRVAQSREKTSEALLLASQINARLEEVSKRLADAGGAAAAPGESLGVLLARAGKFSDDLNAQRQGRSRLERELELCLQRLTDAQSRLSGYEGEKSNWKREWDRAMERLGMAGVRPEKIGAILSALENVFKFLDQHADLTHRVVAMREDISKYSQEVNDLVHQIDGKLADLRPDAAVAELQGRVLAMREAMSKRSQLLKQNVEDEESLAEQQQNGEEAANRLQQLRTKAGCLTVEELERTEDQFEQKQQVVARIADLELNLIERNAAGLETIVAEAEGHDLDQLDIDIESLENYSTQLTNEVVEASTMRGELKNQLRAMENAAGFAEAAQRSEEALAIVRQASEDYVQLRLSIEVLRRAIESYRERHQAPILRRASEIFREITLGEHRDLATDFDDQDRPVLVTVRRNGEKVPMEGLSDGTRDQLYLALRLAAVEIHVAQFGSVPVILDDILINSDDERAAATLKQLASLASRTQVLFFTHHRRLASLAQNVNASVVELQTLAVA